MMNWTEYIFVHLLKDWKDTWIENFIIWFDLMTGRYDDYVLWEGEIPFEECRAAFWASLNTDWTESKRELEWLMEQIKKLESGEINTIKVDL